MTRERIFLLENFRILIREILKRWGESARRNEKVIPNDALASFVIQSQKFTALSRNRNTKAKSIHPKKEWLGIGTKKSRTTLPYLEKYDETITHPLSLRHASPHFLRTKNWNALTSKSNTRRGKEGEQNRRPRDPTIPENVWQSDSENPTRSRSDIPQNPIGRTTLPKNVRQNDCANPNQTPRGGQIFSPHLRKVDSMEYRPLWPYLKKCITKRQWKPETITRHETTRSC